MKRRQVTQRKTPATSHREEALDHQTIAELSNRTVEQLTPDELQQMIEACGHPWRLGLGGQEMRYADPGVLKRMAYLARLCCQNRQMAAVKITAVTSGNPDSQPVTPLTSMVLEEIES